MERSLTNPRWWQRLRHRRGFGVHSPFAFRFITEVLNPPRGYRYYAEECCPDRTGRILARLTGFFAPSGVAYCGRGACALSAPGAPRVPVGSADMIVIDLRDGCPDDVLRRVSRGGVVVFALHHSGGRILSLLAGMPYGMSFRNASTRAVLVVRRNLPRQDFWVGW